MTEIDPAPGFVLVQLGDYYEGIKMPETKYDSKTDGIVLKASKRPRHDDLRLLTTWATGLIGKRVFWGEFREGKRMSFEDKQQAFIRIEDIEGVES